MVSGMLFLGGLGTNALNQIRVYLEKRVNASRKVRGKGDLIFEQGVVLPADSLWFVEQGWTVNQYWKTNDNPEEPGSPWSSSTSALTERR